MKKVFTLLTLALLSIGSAWATGETFTVKFQNSSNVTQSTANYFTYNKGEGTAVSWSSNGKHSCTYGGDTYSNVIKMEGATQCYFTTATEATVTIVQTISNATGDKLKFDDSNLDNNLANTTVTVNSDNKYNEYVITNVAAGKHTITRQSETGLAYVKVEYTGVVLTQLATPEISFNTTTGDVTIGSVSNATKITYTTDGSDPTAESATYSTTLTDVADGTTVKAIAIGDGVSYRNSEIAKKQVLLEGIKVATPNIYQLNGTVAIACATPNVTVEYSTDGGSSWTTFTRSFTLTADTDIKARASRAKCTASDEASATITAVPANFYTRRVILANGAFDMSSNTMTGKDSDVNGKGFTFTMPTKGFAAGQKVYIDAVSTQRTTTKSSNEQITLTMPAGVKATRLTLYSYINMGTGSISWKEVNGTDYSSTVTTIPMGAIGTEVQNTNNTPDIRIFPLDNVEGTITFQESSGQLCYVAVLDIIEPISVEIGSTGYATLYSEHALDFSAATPAGLTASTVTLNTENTQANLTNVDDVPANTGVVLQGTAGQTYTIPVIASSSTGKGILKGSTSETTNGNGNIYVLNKVGDAVGFYKLSATGTLAAGKAYLEIDAGAGAPAFLPFFFGTEATEISSVRVNSIDTNKAAYNLQGQRVMQPRKGLYIIDGKKVVIK